MQSLCDRWEFVSDWYDGFAVGEGEGECVRLPHTVKEIPQHYADSQSYQMVCGYRKKLTLDPTLAGKRLFVQFDGAAHIATVYLNGKELATHRCGYTAFRVDITDAAVLGGENWLAVKLDTTENGEVPPFGFVIDYLTYGGLYREVWLDVREKSYIEDLYITTPDLTTLKIKPTLQDAEGCILLVELQKGERVLVKKAFTAGGVITISCPGVKSWDTEHPILYTCRVSLLKIGRVMDTREVKVGFRTAEFKADGFYLNGKKTFLRGLNRHQCWPYVGYAVPERLQREDARILKQELACVAVRTSHYPQSQYFIDECDRLGLLVFTEIPGWQHIGGENWKDQAVENTREMVLQYRNHPSIVLWGVRINESQDDDELYRRTNAAAHELDPSRATSGVRFLEKSHLLEDVYAYNDFSHTGDNPGCKPRRAVMSQPEKGTADLRAHRSHVPHQVLRYLEPPAGAGTAPRKGAERRRGRRRPCGLLRLVHVRLPHSQGFRLRRPGMLPWRHGRLPQPQARGGAVRQSGRGGDGADGLYAHGHRRLSRRTDRGFGGADQCRLRPAVQERELCHDPPHRGLPRTAPSAYDSGRHHRRASGDAGGL